MIHHVEHLPAVSEIHCHHAHDYWKKPSATLDQPSGLFNVVENNHKDFKFEEYGALKRSYPRGFHGVYRFGRPNIQQTDWLTELDLQNYIGLYSCKVLDKKVAEVHLQVAEDTHQFQSMDEFRYMYRMTKSDTFMWRTT